MVRYGNLWKMVKQMVECNCGRNHESDGIECTRCPACHQWMCPDCADSHGYDKQGKTDLCHDPKLLHSYYDNHWNYHINDGNKGIQSKYIIEGLLKSNSEK